MEPNDAGGDADRHNDDDYKPLMGGETDGEYGMRRKIVIPPELRFTPTRIRTERGTDFLGNTGASEMSEETERLAAAAAEEEEAWEAARARRYARNPPEPEMTTKALDRLAQCEPAARVVKGRYGYTSPTAHDQKAFEIYDLRTKNAALLAALEESKATVENLMESARHFASGSDFYRGIVAQCGELLGPESYVSDDGSVQDSVLALKVPELLAARLDQMRTAQSEPFTYVFRTKPTWRKTWGAWTECSKGLAGDMERNPVGIGWQYEVKRLYTAPAAQSEPVADDAGFEELLAVVVNVLYRAGQHNSGHAAEWLSDSYEVNMLRAYFKQSCAPKPTGEQR